ncbi:hypothetical protein [Tropicimonas isoalkanivorans]|uniref:Uncharacterized protein n=1 Tax=Tropicimonas isoalkanivorans TaxID=441112 RepID=A0A1I1DAW2_9RHOB|nr:hypothetical protein [Tropicimonas isoalkanivorans]SFB70218.1 hypothetical protein SAMN04488094_1018 [Tropicimonas isoalkanivorans]
MMKGRDDEETDAQQMTRVNRIAWHLINALIGIFPGAVVAVQTDSDVAGVCGWAGWVTLGIVLARVGFWDLVADVLGWIARPFTTLLETIQKSVSFIFIGIASVIGTLIAFAFSLFVLLGLLGLLWFGVKQLF